MYYIDLEFYCVDCPYFKPYLMPPYIHLMNSLVEPYEIKRYGDVTCEHANNCKRVFRKAMESI